MLTDNMSNQIVQTVAGKVIGKVKIGMDGIKYHSFKGIPYAKPPTGDLRFKDPKPLEPWIGIRDATSHGPNCAQKEYFTREIRGSDDCLYLNVYARCIDSKQKWPVMVWIHGGGFICGSGDVSMYGPDYFVRKNVVLVTINYRLGVLGFLNLDDQVATGNQGLKDQVMALQWVRDNINNFGGDANNVTIFGESAGGASVHYLTLSPLAEGLFHKAIIQSGVVLNLWAYYSNLKEKAFRLCDELGHTKKDSKSIAEFLRGIDARKLIEAQENIATKEEKLQFVSSFGPSIDSKSKTPFMPVHPEQAAAEGIKVRLIIGHTNREGICYLRNIIAKLKQCDNNTSELVEPSRKKTFKKLYNLTAEEFVRIYLNDEQITEENYDKVADLMGDLHFVEGIQRVMKNQIDKNCPPTFFYQFTYDREPSIIKTMMNVKIDGAVHMDDLFFLFRSYFFEDKIKIFERNAVRYKIIEQMIELWVNFATTGTPTPKLSELLPINWHPIENKSGLRYLDIGENLRMELVLDIGQHYIARKYPKKHD